MKAPLLGVVVKAAGKRRELPDWTRREYIHVGSGAASMLRTVLVGKTPTPASTVIVNSEFRSIYLMPVQKRP